MRTRSVIASLAFVALVGAGCGDQAVATPGVAGNTSAGNTGPGNGDTSPIGDTGAVSACNPNGAPLPRGQECVGGDGHILYSDPDGKTLSSIPFDTSSGGAGRSPTDTNAQGLPIDGNGNAVPPCAWQGGC